MTKFDKLALISFGILIVLMALFVRGQIFADGLEGRAGPFGYRFINGRGMVNISLAYASSQRDGTEPPKPVPLLRHFDERVTEHSMFWLSDGNPFGIRVRGTPEYVPLSGRTFGFTIELDMGLLFLLAGAIPGYWYFSVRRQRRTRRLKARKSAEL